MASIETLTGKAGKTYRIRLSKKEHPDRLRIGLGDVTKRQADSAQRNIQNLLAANRSGGDIPLATLDWLAKLPDSLRNRLECLEIVAPRKKVKPTAVTGWVDGYIKSRTDAKPGTIKAMQQAADNLAKFTGKDTLMSDFTPFEADEFRRYLLAKGLAESTVRRRCKYAKQFMEAAIKNRLVKSNPFADVPVAGRINSDRQRFISKDDIQAVIEECPNSQWRLIFAMSRYGGLRIPSELFGLRWEDILWDKKRFVIHSPKTEHIEGKATRICPIFPELEPYLLAAFE
jgi:integrase